MNIASPTGPGPRITFVIRGVRYTVMASQMASATSKDFIEYPPPPDPDDPDDPDNKSVGFPEPPTPS